ncbi:MAG TPA: DUF92 domain-containing protein [Thermoprotei archaeon]|nr:DUF92 domain-containing protein [Thermoprotei archaeon]
MYEDFIIKSIVLLGITAFVYVNKFLDGNALILSLAIGAIVLFIGGWGYFILLLIFLIVGSFMAKLVENTRSALRTWYNVLANGFWPALSIAILPFSPDKITPAIFYLGSLNAMFSDTVSTEVGIYLGDKPRLITSPKKIVDKGLSGGVTIDGLLGGFLAAYSFALISSVLINFSWNSVFINSIWLSGFISSVSDSLLGSLLQVKYRCSVCGKTVEYNLHCGSETTYLNGFKWINNHTVNFLSSLVGGLLAVLFFNSFNMLYN